MGKPDAFLLNYGYQGMISIIDSLLTRRDVVVYDSEAHACIIDGLRLQGKRFVYPHNDAGSLHQAARPCDETGRGERRRRVVITEGVFGMKGDLGKLDEIVAMKKDFNFRLVDDAHGSTGTMGKRGSGTPEHFGVTDGVDVLFQHVRQVDGRHRSVRIVREVHRRLSSLNIRSQTYAKALRCLWSKEHSRGST